MADQFRKRVSLRRLERLGLDDQVVVARGRRWRDKVDADRRRRAAVICRGELVDDRLHARRRVLRRLRVLSGFAGMMLLIETAMLFAF